MDAIDRQAAIDYIKSQRGRLFKGFTIEEAVLTLIREVPSIPERKKGKWLETDSHEPCWYKCDQCGRLSDIKEIYCPTCGASMVNTTCGADMRGET